jgi:tRNA dimethylallyltransferase
LEEARELWIRNTRAYAKRQITWCRKHKGLLRFAAGDVRGMANAVTSWFNG